MKRSNVDRARALGPYIAGFACTDTRLIVELDGGRHAERAGDEAKRTRWLESGGYRVLRFWNDDVLKNTDRVLERIAAALSARAQAGATNEHAA